MSVASAGLVAFPFNSSKLFRSFDFTASSAACLIIPHLTHISTLSAGVALVHFGMKTEASFGFPAESRALKKGSHPIGDLRVLDRVSISDQAREAMCARSLEDVH